MTELSGDREVEDALRRLARSTGVPPVAPDREAALLAAFDRRAIPPRSSAGAWVWLSALTTLTMLLLAALLPLRSPAPRPSAHVQAPAAATDFIPWPGAAELPPLESGELVRVDLPVSILPALGIAPPAAPAGSVTADVVVGQDGLARAVRLVGN
jgi:hypothetical protein